MWNKYLKSRPYNLPCSHFKLLNNECKPWALITYKIPTNLSTHHKILSQAPLPSSPLLHLQNSTKSLFWVPTSTYQDFSTYQNWLGLEYSQRVNTTIHLNKFITHFYIHTSQKGLFHEGAFYSVSIQTLQPFFASTRTVTFCSFNTKTFVYETLRRSQYYYCSWRGTWNCESYRFLYIQ